MSGYDVVNLVSSGPINCIGAWYYPLAYTNTKGLIARSYGDIYMVL